MPLMRAMLDQPEEAIQALEFGLEWGIQLDPWEMVLMTGSANNQRRSLSNWLGSSAERCSLRGKP